MGQSILLKRSAIPGKKPSANSINLGEVALNTYDGRIFFKRSGSSESVEEVITTNAINTGSIGLYGGVNNQNYLLNITGYNDYFQGIYLQNLSNSTSASSDLAIYNDDSVSYVDIGINSTTYQSSSEAFTTLGQSGDAYVYAAANNFYIGNASAGQEVVIFNGGFNTVDNAKITIHDQGSIVINKGQSYNPTYPEALVVNAAPGADFNLITAYNDTNNYSQINTKNLNSGSDASTDIVATADNGDEFLYYVDLGINSSGYNAGIVGEANDGYLINAGKNFYIGTQGDNYYGTNPSANMYFFTNDNWVNPEIMISGSHVVGFGTTNVTNGYKYEFNGGDIKINNNVLVVGTLYATASNAVSASYAVTASYALNAGAGAGFPFSGSGVITGSLLISGSGGLNVLGPINGQDITASSLLVNGTITAQTLVVQTITASVEYVSGSTQFGSSSNDTHQFTGSVRVTGSLSVNGSDVVLSNQTGSMSVLTASYAATASFVPTSSLVGNFFVQGGNSFEAQAVLGTNDNHNLALETSGFIRVFVSSSGNVGINTVTPIAQLDVSGSGRFTNSVEITGSLNATGSTNLIGLLSVNGNISLTGSRTIQTTTASVATKGPTLSLVGGNGGSTSGDGGDILIKGGNAINTTNIGGDVYIYGGDKTGAGRAGDIRIGAAGNNYQVYLQGGPIFNWDGPNDLNAVRFQRGGSTRFLIYDDVNLNSNYYFRGGSNSINAIWDNWNTMIVRGKAATSASTAFQVQNSNSSSSLVVLNNGFVGIGTSTPAHLLDVSGSARVQDNLNLLITKGINFHSGFKSNLGGYSISVASNGDFRFVTADDSSVNRPLTIGYYTGDNPASTFNEQSRINTYTGLASFKRLFLTSNTPGTSPNASSILQIESSTQGFLEPRMTAAQRTAISSPAQGLQVYDISSGTEGMWYYDSGSIRNWTRLLNDSGSQTITGSLTVSGPITSTGTITAQTLVVQTITTSVEYVTGSTQFGSLLSNTHQFTGSVRITGSLDVVGNITATSFTGQINANNGIVSGSSQIDVTQTTGYTIFSQSLAGTDTSQSVSILIASQSAWGAFQSASAYSSSAANVDNEQNLRLNSIETFTSSVAGINAFTASIANTNTFTQSAGLRLNSLESFTASVAGTNVFTASIAGTNLFTASINSKTGSFATTGSNRFVGNQIITGSTITSGSVSIIGSGSSIFTVDGISGRLFSIDDSLSGSLFSVNTAAGLPVMEAFSDNTIRIGQYGQRALFISQSKVGIGKEVGLNGVLDVSGSVTITGSFTASLQSGYVWVGDSNGNSRAVTTASFISAGTISGSSQIDITQTTGYTSFSQSLAGTDATQSVNIIVVSQSAWGAFQSASAYSASAATVDIAQNLRLDSLETFTSSANIRLSNLENRTGSYTTTSSFNSFTQSYYVDSASFDNRVKSALAGATPPGTISGSIQVDITQTTGYTIFSQSLAGTDTTQSVNITIVSQSAWGAFQSASAYSASAATVDIGQDLRLNSIELKTGSFATTGSNTFTGNQTVNGTITAVNLIVTTITASTEYASGSTRFGSNNSNTHEFTGSVKITGSLDVVGPVTSTSFSGQINANNGIISGSSQVDITQTTGYTIFSQSLAGTDTSQSVNITIISQSAWGAFQSASAYSSSAATIDNGQNLRLDSIENFTASLNSKTGSYATTGSNSFTGTQTITGSLNVSGSNYSYTGYSTAVGANTISSIATGSYNGAFYNYVAISGSNARAGQITAIWLGNTITYTETTTTDIGNTNGVGMAVQISSGLVQLIGTTTTTPWTIKTSINLI